MQKFLAKMENKLRRYAPSNWVNILVAGTAIVFVLDLFLPLPAFGSVSGLLYFDRAAILRGQIWRLFTFVFVPASGSIFSMALSLYFTWLIGNALENRWGTVRFDLFYLVGVLSAIAAGFITGYASSYYLNLSLFFAFAILYPDFEVLVFFLLPVKMKYLAILDAVYFIYLFAAGTASVRVTIAAAIFNLVLFFSGSVADNIRNYRRRKKWNGYFK